MWIRADTGLSVDGVVDHSDAGIQYTSIRCFAPLVDAGAGASIRTGGEATTNTLAESVIDLDEAEMRPSRRLGPHRRRPRATDADLDPLLQPDLAAQRPGPRPAARVRPGAQSSDQPRTAANSGETRSPLAPGRFKTDGVRQSHEGRRRPHRSRAWFTASGRRKRQPSAMLRGAIKAETQVEPLTRTTFVCSPLLANWNASAASSKGNSAETISCESTAPARSKSAAAAKSSAV